MIYRSIDLRWLGQSGFRIKTAGGRIIYIDPYKISEENPRADFIFITHSHYDHCSIEDIQKIARDGTVIVCPADVSSKMRHIAARIDIRLAEVGEQIEFDDGGIKVWPVLAYNLTKPAHSLDEGWVGYVLDLNGVLIYHAGDTDVIPEMKKLSTSNIDIALLPIGGTFTMNAGEAAKAASIIKPKLVIPMHYGSVSGIGNKSDADTFAKLCGSEVNVKVLVRED